MQSPERDSSAAQAEQPSDEHSAASFAERLEGADPAVLLAELSALPDTAASRILTGLAATPGDGALALLRLAAQEGRAAIAQTAISLLGAVRRQEAADTLAAIGAQRADREKAKAARKALYRLSLAGVKPSATPPAAATPTPEPEKVYACLATYIDPTGDHTFYVVRQNRFGTLSLGMFVLNEDDGVVDAHGAIPCSLSLWKRQLDLLAQREIETVPVDLPFVRQQVDVAEARNTRTNTPLPPDYWPIRRLLQGPAAETAPPPELANEAVRNDPSLLASSRDLLRQAPFDRWLFTFKEVRPYALRAISEVRRERQMGAAREQDLPVADLGRLQREGATVSVALNEIVDGARRARFQEQLEFTSELLWRAGKPQAAREAKAAALALAPDSVLPIEQHPLLRDMMHKTLSVVMELEEAGGDADTGVARPDQPAEAPEEKVDEQGFIRRKSGLILPR